MRRKGDCHSVRAFLVVGRVKNSVLSLFADTFFNSCAAAGVGKARVSANTKEDTNETTFNIIG